MNRRSLLAGLGDTLLVAPAIVRASSLMPVKTFFEIDLDFWGDMIEIADDGTIRMLVPATEPFWICSFASKLAD